MKRGLFVGRFQPPHLGHLHAIRQALKDCDELIVAVGSAQYSHTFENPFTAGERIEMLRLAFQEAGIGLERLLIIPVPDIGEHGLWVAKVVSFTPSFQVVYTNNHLVKRLFEEAGYEVKQLVLYKREKEMGTIIRKRMLTGEEWENLVPRSVAEYIKKIKGVERIREISKGDF